MDRRSAGDTQGDDFYEAAFARNIGIFTPEEQRKLAGCTVAVAGLGGIGGNAAMTLARMGVGRFRIADFDRYEAANINRQSGARADTIGRLKCDVVAEDLRRINPAAQVTVFTEGFTEETGDALLDGADLAIDSMDFYSVRTHVAFHRRTRAYGLFTLMGCPVGFSACLQVFDPHGMSFEEYCGIDPAMDLVEQRLRYASGLVPELAHHDYYDVSTANSDTDFAAGLAPSVASACMLAASLVAGEAVMLMLGRRRPKAIPHTFQFDPYTFRYAHTYTPGGMRNFDPAPLLKRLGDRSSFVPQVLDFLYGKTQSQRVAANGAELYHRAEGEGDPLVLVSPLGNDSGFWARQVDEFARRHKVITFDARGTGVSTPAQQGCSVELLADDLIALIEELRLGPVHLAGMAVGGLVAARVAAERPDLARSLVLASCYPVADEHIRRITAGWREIAAARGMEEVYESYLEWVFTPEYVRASRKELDKLKLIFRLTAQDPASFVQHSLAAVGYDARPDLARVRCPALVVHGAADRLVVPERGRQLAAALREPRFVEVEGAPHYLTWEQADRFNHTVMEFLGAPAPSVYAGD